MSVYLNSTDVQVFPSARRIDERFIKDARLLSETNLARIISQIIDRDSFLITNELTDNTELIEFCIKGYYFAIKKNELLDNSDLKLSDGDRLLAKIILTKMSDPDNDFVLYNGVDEGNNYLGVMFEKSSYSNTPVNPKPKHSIDEYGRETIEYSLILCYGGAGGQQTLLYDDSKIKFTNKSIKNIDGGEI